MASPHIHKRHTLRFQTPANASFAKPSAANDAAAASAIVSRRNGLFQDSTTRHQKHEWSPSVWTAFRLLIIIRVSSAMYSVINDCDETFGYWEPLHLLVFPSTTTSNAAGAFQTWEYSPTFALRSWAFVAQFAALPTVLAWLRVGRRQLFFAVRLALAFGSAFVDARFYTTVAHVFGARVARYCLIALACSAGMYHASTALLPSTFVMHATTLAFSFSLYPSRLPASHPSILSTPSQPPFQPYRVVLATLSFSTGAILGWPYALILALPFVFEQLFLHADDTIANAKHSQWLLSRWSTAITPTMLATILLLPVVTIDSLAYGSLSFPPLNTILYNLFSHTRALGPHLYGTEPFSFYFFNLLLNFNLFFPLALLSLPLLVLTATVHPKRFVRSVGVHAKKPIAKRQRPSSLVTLALVRLVPFYLWFGLLSVQAHKEERFMYPAYTLLCLNAAVSLDLVRTLLEVVFVKLTASPYRASRSSLFTMVTSTILAVGVVFGVLRTVGQMEHYHSSFDVMFHFEAYELPRVVAQLFPETLSPAVQTRIQNGLSAVATQHEREYNDRGYGAHNNGVSVDLSISLEPLQRLHTSVRLCYGKEWYRFPSHFLVPAGVEVEWIRSEFRGILPKHFDVRGESELQQPDSVVRLLDARMAWVWPWSSVTRRVQHGFNQRNLEEMDRYVDVSTCDYLVDVDFPHRSLASGKNNHAGFEPRFGVQQHDGWERVFCAKFLDAEYSRPVSHPNDSFVTRWVRTALGMMHRSFWLPKVWPGNANLFGDYCLLRNANSTFSPKPPTASASASASAS